jgi:hypothetical protein
VVLVPPCDATLAPSTRQVHRVVHNDDRERLWPWVLEWPAIACWVGNVLPHAAHGKKLRRLGLPVDGSPFIISGRDGMPPERAGDDVVRTPLEDVVWRGERPDTDLRVATKWLLRCRSYWVLDRS